MSSSAKLGNVPPSVVAAIRKATGAPWIECRRYLERLSGEDMDKVVQAAEVIGGRALQTPVQDLSLIVQASRNAGSSYLRDPLETDPAIGPLIEQIQIEAERLASIEFMHHECFSRLGECHLVWRIMQRLLKERHGIHWRTPAQMNPWACFD